MSNLQTIRKEKGLSQGKLAAASGVNVSMIQFYEQGVKDINMAAGITLKKLADALGCKMDDLLEPERKNDENTTT